MGKKQKAMGEWAFWWQQGRVGHGWLAINDIMHGEPPEDKTEVVEWAKHMFEAYVPCSKGEK